MLATLTGPLCATSHGDRRYTGSWVPVSTVFCRAAPPPSSRPTLSDTCMPLGTRRDRAVRRVGVALPTEQSSSFVDEPATRRLGHAAAPRPMLSEAPLDVRTLARRTRRGACGYHRHRARLSHTTWKPGYHLAIAPTEPIADRCAECRLTLRAQQRRLGCPQPMARSGSREASGDGFAAATEGTTVSPARPLALAS